MIREDQCSICRQDKKVEFKMKYDPVEAPYRESVVDPSINYHDRDMVIKRVFCSHCGIVYHEGTI